MQSRLRRVPLPSCFDLTGNWPFLAVKAKGSWPRSSSSKVALISARTSWMVHLLHPRGRGRTPTGTGSGRLLLLHWRASMAKMPKTFPSPPSSSRAGVGGAAVAGPRTSLLPPEAVREREELFLRGVAALGLGGVRAPHDPNI